MAAPVIDLSDVSGSPIKKVRFNDGDVDYQNFNSNGYPGAQRNRKRGRGGKPNRNNGNPYNEGSGSGNSGGQENLNQQSGSGHGPQVKNELQHHRGGSSLSFAQKLRQLSKENFLELAPIPINDLKFSGRSRLYVGNLVSKTTEADLREMFKPYGEIDDIYSNFDKNFTFLRVDYYDNAVKAKRALDGSVYNGRAIRVSFAPNATVVRVSNLNHFVSNELLYKSFEIFGAIERAVVKVDDRGKHLGEGFVEFALKSSAKMCLRMCQEKCFFLTASLRPCLVEPMDLADNAEGLSDMSLNRKLPDFVTERSVGPRFAEIDSFEHDYGSRWKKLHDLYKTKQETLKRELRREEDELDAQIEFIRDERETERLRKELRQRELMQERRQQYWLMREKRADEEVNIRDYRHGMPACMDRQENGLQRNHQDDMDGYGFNRCGDYQGPNIDPNARHGNEFYRNEMQERVLRQGDAMQRYQQNDFERVHEFYHSTPFKVFECSSNQDLEVTKNNIGLNETEDLVTEENIEEGRGIF